MIRAFWLIALILSSSPMLAQNPFVPTTPPKAEIPLKPSPAIPSTTHPLTAADVEAFLGGIIPMQLQNDDIAGATIAVVKNGQLLFARGYGYADYEKKTPVSAESTLFRPGSVSKLFTWTAVMQLAEQRKLDLDRDVNAYLDFKIPEAYGKPITLKNLLTHTPGFEEKLKHLFVTASEKPSLGAYLKSHTPERIYPPGTTTAYSNYGAALAGYIVEQVSGRPFPQYVAENIFAPLGMSRSTFVQPLPAPLAAQMSNGYKLASDGPKSFEIVGPDPAGSMSATATDMARFMIAHLQGGQSGGARILRPETVRLMQSTLFEVHPAANGMAHGFYEESRNGHRIIGHAGDTAYFHSDLHLIPDSNVGLFVSYNSLGRGTTPPRSKLWEAFLDRYFPDPSLPQATLPSADNDARAVSGSYLGSRRSESSFVRALFVLGEFTVAPSQDGSITVSQLKGPNGKPRRWREVAPLVFRDVDGQDSLSFKRDAAGGMDMMISPYPFFVFQRVGLWRDRRVLLPVLVVSLALMVLTLVLWPVAALVRRHYRHPLELTHAERWVRLAVRIVFVLNIVFLAAIVGIVMYGSSTATFNDRLDKWILLAQLIGLLGAAGSLIVFYDAIQSWISKRKRIWSRLYASVLALACLGFLWFVLAGNLLRFTTSY